MLADTFIEIDFMFKKSNYFTLNMNTELASVW